MPKVSIVIINYNGKGLTVDCLKSLEKQTFKDFEVIIVDNASADSSLNEIYTFVKSGPLPSNIKIVPLKRNTGFSGGNIEGLRHSKSEYIALLNNDTEPASQWLEELVKAMDSNPEVGICGSKLIVYGTNIIDSAGDGFSISFKGFKRGEGELSSLYDKMEYAFGACAGAALYRKKMIDEIGFLDEDFFLIHEDTDLNLRSQLYGWKVLFVPKAEVYHKVRSTIGNMSDTAVYYTLRNSEFVRIKNLSFPLFVRFFPELLLGFLAEFLYFAIKHGHLILYFKAKADAIKMLPIMLKKRRIIMDSKQIENRDLIKIMAPIFEWRFLKKKLRKFIIE